MSTPNGAIRPKKKRDVGGIVISVLFAIVCVIYIMPIILVLINSFKANSAINTDTFSIPTGDAFVGMDNYVNGMTF